MVSNIFTTRASRFTAACENTSRSTSSPSTMTCAPFDATKSMQSTMGSNSSHSVSKRRPDVAANRTPLSRRRRMSSYVPSGTHSFASSMVPSMSLAMSLSMGTSFVEVRPCEGRRVVAA